MAQAILVRAYTTKDTTTLNRTTTTHEVYPPYAQRDHRVLCHTQ